MKSLGDVYRVQLQCSSSVRTKGSTQRTKNTDDGEKDPSADVHHARDPGRDAAEVPGPWQISRATDNPGIARDEEHDDDRSPEHDENQRGNVNGVQAINKEEGVGLTRIQPAKEHIRVLRGAAKLQ